MTSPASRAGALLAIGTLAVLAPVLGAGTVVLFGLIAVVALVLPVDSPIFERLATPDERAIGRLRSIGEIGLAITVLALLTTVGAGRFSTDLFVMVVLAILVGNAFHTLLGTYRAGEGATALAFVVAGGAASFAGYALLELSALGAPTTPLGGAVLIATLGPFLGALDRTARGSEDGLQLLAVGAAMWFLGIVGGDLAPLFVVVALSVSVALGSVAYLTGTASVPGTICGVILAALTFTLGGPGWFAMLFAFFGVGAIATKYRYADKAALGVAEPEGGKRGPGNVLSNGGVPLAIVLLWATVRQLPDADGLSESIFVAAFAGAVATALADTLASELGALYENPRMITSLERVAPGTDGAVSVHGHLAGFVGAAIVAGLLLVFMPELGGAGAGLVILGGLIGMSADSVLGATLEGKVIGNEGVNFLATLCGAVTVTVAYLALTAAVRLPSFGFS